MRRLARRFLRRPSPRPHRRSSRPSGRPPRHPLRWLSGRLPGHAQHYPAHRLRNSPRRWLSSNRFSAAARSWWGETTEGIPRVFWFLWTGSLLNRIGYVVQPFLALYLTRELGFGLGLSGVIVACFGLGMLFSPLIGGYLADHVGRRFTLIVGMLGTATAFCGLMLAYRLIIVVLFTLAAGLATDLYRPAVAASVIDIVAPAARARAFVLNYWAANLGLAFAGIIGGFLAEHQFWLLFLLDAATCLAFAVVTALRVRETKPETVETVSTSYRVVLHDRLAMGLVALALAAAMIYQQAFVTLPLVLTDDHLSPAVFGLLNTTNAVTVIVFQPVLMRWFTRWPVIAVISGAQFVQGLGFGLMAFAHATMVYVVMTVIWTLGEIALNAVLSSVITSIAPAQARARYSAAHALTFGAAAFLAPLIGTTILAYFGSGWLWSLCFLVGLVAALATWAVAPALAERQRVMAAADEPLQTAAAS